MTLSEGRPFSISADKSCVQRFFRIVTVPPFHEEEERFDCDEMAAGQQKLRPIRIAYRGLAYSGMSEREVLLLLHYGYH